MPVAQAMSEFGLNAAALKEYKNANPQQLRHECQFTFYQIREASFSVSELSSAFSLGEFKGYGMSVGCLEQNFNISQLAQSGYTLIEMKGGGFGIVELKGAGYT